MSRVEAMRIGGITDMSTVDWYGNVSLVVFFAGCNIRCPYCQNSSLIPIDSGQIVSMEVLEERLRIGLEPVPQLDAVVLTGGEPLLQPDAVLTAAGIAKKQGLKVMLDTNGTLYDSARKVISSGLVDRVALDVKAPLEADSYGKVTGRPEVGASLVSSVDSVLDLCRDLNIEMEARTTVVPGLSDDVDFIRSIADDIRGRVDVYYLQQFDNEGDVLSPELKNKNRPTRDQMLTLAQAANETGLSPVYIKTRFEGLELVT